MGWKRGLRGGRGFNWGWVGLEIFLILFEVVKFKYSNLNARI